MQRSKQQAAMFLLGAVLVGGVLGFSANRVVSSYAAEQDQERRIDRPTFFDDLDFTADQRERWEAINDTASCRIMIVTETTRPEVEGIRTESRAKLQGILTKAQKDKWERRQRDDSVRRAREDSAVRANRAAARTAATAKGDTAKPQTPRRRPGRLTLETCRVLLNNQGKH
jgi:hypothetical protein